jgi:uncharacterized protein (TIGR02266 family)
MPDERRTARRAILPGVQATFEGATGERQQADVPNLGRGGLFLQTDSPVPTGKRLSLEIHIVGQPAPWSALGRVAWARWLADDDGPAGMGVTLIDVEDDVSGALEALVERLSPLEPPPIVPDAPPSRPRVPGAGPLPPAPAVFIAPLAYPGRAAEIEARERDSAASEASHESDVAIDLVTRKAASSLPVDEAEPLEHWDESFLKRKRRSGRWIVLGLLLGTAGVGYLCRDRLLAQWARLRTIAIPGQTEAPPTSAVDARA